MYNNYKLNIWCHDQMVGQNIDWKMLAKASLTLGKLQANK